MPRKSSTTMRSSCCRRRSFASGSQDVGLHIGGRTEVSPSGVSASVMSPASGWAVCESPSGYPGRFTAQNQRAVRP